ncbi:hypothetical protein Bbelb_177380 [Branchiostoma belcheri]|nr:hypothetical protein Bbelb_177380 [Branchiostoma belcheri]
MHLDCRTGVAGTGEETCNTGAPGTGEETWLQVHQVQMRRCGYRCTSYSCAEGDKGRAWHQPTRALTRPASYEPVYRCCTGQSTADSVSSSQASAPPRSPGYYCTNTRPHTHRHSSAIQPTQHTVDFELRSAISKIRVSAHPLEIERGRYRRLPCGEPALQATGGVSARQCRADLETQQTCDDSTRPSYHCVLLTLQSADQESSVPSTDNGICRTTPDCTNRHSTTGEGRSPTILNLKYPYNRYNRPSA